MKWNKLTTRKMTEEEKEKYPQFDYMWDGQTPEYDEKILVFDPKYKKSIGVYTDIWLDFHEEGEGFDNTFLENGDTVYWMKFPEPPKINYEGGC